MNTTKITGTLAVAMVATGLCSAAENSGHPFTTTAAAPYDSNSRVAVVCDKDAQVAVPCNKDAQTDVPVAGGWNSHTDAATDAIKNALRLYKAESDSSFIQEVKLSWMEQYQIAVVQPSGGNGSILKPGASPFNQEFRRSWVGLNVKTNTGTLFHTWMRIGGLPMRSTYVGGRTRKNYSYADIFDLYIRQDIPGVDGLSVSVGKLKPLFTMDYTEASSKIKCVERSVIGQFSGLDSNWGIDVTYKPQKNLTFYVQLLANDRANNAKSMSHSDVYRDGRGLKGEFGWEDKCYAILGARYRFHETADSSHEVVFQYAHDFNNVYDGHREPGANCYGIGMQDGISVGYIYNRNKFTLMANAVAFFDVLGAEGGGGSNCYGLQVQPSYLLTPNVELVLRYTALSSLDFGNAGGNPVRLAADRYICTQTIAPAWVEHLNAFYIGANFFLSAKNPDALKFMIGAEYMTTRAWGDTAYCGWEFTSAVRWSF